MLPRRNNQQRASDGRRRYVMNTITIHTIAQGWEAADTDTDKIEMDRNQLAAALRTLLKLPAEPADGESVASRVWEEKIAAPFRAAYRMAYIERRKAQGLPCDEVNALNAARQALFKLKGRAKIRTADEVTTDKPKPKPTPKAKTGRKKTTYACPCCKATLSINGKALVKVAAPKRKPKPKSDAA